MVFDALGSFVGGLPLSPNKDKVKKNGLEAWLIYLLFWLTSFCSIIMCKLKYRKLPVMSFGLCT